MKNNNKVNGFTLLELVIIVAMFALLVQMASTSYRDAMLKASRLSRKIILYDTQLAYQRCYLSHLSHKACKPQRYDGFSIVESHAATDPTRLILRPLPEHPDFQDEACFEWMLGQYLPLTVYSKSGHENTSACRV